MHLSILVLRIASIIFVAFILVPGLASAELRCGKRVRGMVMDQEAADDQLAQRERRLRKLPKFQKKYGSQDEESLDGLVYRNSKAALRMLIRLKGHLMDQGLLKEMMRGKDVSRLSGEEAFGIYNEMSVELGFAAERARLRRDFEGYYEQLANYTMNLDSNRLRRMDVAIYHSKLQVLSSEHEAVFLDNSFTDRRALSYLYSRMPDFRGFDDQMVLLPSAASENYSRSVGAANTRTVSMWLSPKFSSPLSDIEERGLKGIIEELLTMAVGQGDEDDDSVGHMDRYVVAEAMLAGSESKNRRAQLWLRDRQFISPLWKAAQRFHIPLEKADYAFQLFSEFREFNGAKVPIVRIVTTRPVQSELIVIHPYMRNGDHPGSIAHVKNTAQLP